MKTPTTHFILACAVCLAVLAGYNLWYGAIATKSATATALQEKIDTRTETVSRLATTQMALAEIERDEAVIQNHFVPETGVVAFINGLQARGRAMDAVVSVLSVSTDNLSQQSALAFTLSITGKFDAVMRTVGTIEYAPYAISISSLSVGQDAKNSWHADLKLLVGSSAITASSAAHPHD